MSRRPCRQCGNDGDNKTVLKIRAVNFVAIEDGDRWTRRELARATASDTEI